MQTLHPRAFKTSVVWTLALLWLGSVVHATESSLACPDWPTCYGTMMPEMSGGVFWEHLHRLVAGGLLLMWGLATWLAHRETSGPRRWIVRAGLVGLGLLIVQSIFGGLTVLFLLPDLVSTTHLTLALVFLSLATFLASVTRHTRERLSAPLARFLRRGAGLAAGLVLAQCVVGGLVRHMDAGMACPDIPLCHGQVVPPLDNALVTVHFLHRALGLAVVVAVIALAVRARREDAPGAVRGWIDWAVAATLLQVGLGVLSVLTGLAVVPVSLHTLVAASLLATLVHVAALGADPAPAERLGSSATVTATS